MNCFAAGRRLRDKVSFSLIFLVESVHRDLYLDECNYSPVLDRYTGETYKWTKKFPKYEGMDQ